MNIYDTFTTTCLQCAYNAFEERRHKFYITFFPLSTLAVVTSIKTFKFCSYGSAKRDNFTYIFPFLQFVAHPNCQQLLASLWYEGLPGFRRHNIVSRLMITFLIGFTFPLLSLFYLFAPKSRFGKLIRKPFIKFICHSASYITFLGEFCWLYNMKNR